MSEKKQEQKAVSTKKVKADFLKKAIEAAKKAKDGRGNSRVISRLLELKKKIS